MDRERQVTQLCRKGGKIHMSHCSFIKLSELSTKFTVFTDIWLPQSQKYLMQQDCIHLEIGCGCGRSEFASLGLHTLATTSLPSPPAQVVFRNLVPPITVLVIYPPFPLSLSPFLILWFSFILIGYKTIKKNDSTFVMCHSLNIFQDISTSREWPGVRKMKTRKVS